MDEMSIPAVHVFEKDATLTKVNRMFVELCFLLWHSDYLHHTAQKKLSPLPTKLTRKDDIA